MSDERRSTRNFSQACEGAINPWHPDSPVTREQNTANCSRGRERGTDAGRRFADDGSHFRRLALIPPAGGSPLERVVGSRRRWSRTTAGR